MMPNVDQIERQLLEIIRSLYARDLQVTGLLDIPAAQLRVLNVLANYGENFRPAMGELAETLGITLSTATQLVERIEKRGLVLREHSDPEDRRIVRLGLTEQGRILAGERRRLRHERLAAVLNRLTAAQQSSLLAALEPLAEAASQISLTDTQKEAGFLALLQEVR